MPTIARSSRRAAARLFSCMTGALVIFLAVISTAPAFAVFAGWSTPVNLSVSGRDAVDPQVAVDDAGNAVAVWQRFDGSNTIIQSSRLAAGGVSWSTPENLSLPGQDADLQQVSMDGSGNAVAVWQRYDGDHYVIQSSGSSDSGVSWSTPENLSLPGQYAYNPHVAVDGSGKVVAIWQRYDGDHYVIQSSGSSDSGVSWSTPVNLSASDQEADNPRVAINDSGIAVAVFWRAAELGNQIVQSIRSIDGGITWVSPRDLSASDQHAIEPQVGLDASGNAVVVWRRSNGSNDIVQSSRSANGGVSWSTPVNLSASGQDADHPQVAVDGSGNAVAVWQRFDGRNYIVQSRGSSDGGASWSTPENLSLPGQDADLQQVSMDGSGNAVAVWQRFDGSNTIIQSSRLAAGGVSWSTPVNLSASGKFAESPQVAVDGSGNAVAVWHRGPPNNNIVQSSFSSGSNGGGGGGGEELANTGAGVSVNAATVIASAGLLVLGVLTRVLIRRRSNSGSARLY
jgi:hypothetical protein